jgi:pimeloyl-ACP methyl ester carboxylesterase
MMSNEGDGFEDFATGTVELGAGRIHYREAGTGEPLVFVHGFGAGGNLWSGAAAALAGSHRCILPELPFGAHPEAMRADADLSPAGAAEIVAELLAALELDRVTLVGNDSGGAISQIVVTAHPERISRLVLTNCDCFEVFPPGRFKLLTGALRVPGFTTLLATAMRFDLVRRSPLAYGELAARPIDGDVLDSWLRPSLVDRGVRRDLKKFGSGLDPRYTMRAAERLPQLGIPALIAWGEDDRFFTMEMAERLAAAIPDSRLVGVPDARTFVSLDQPERLAAEIDAFVAATPAAPTAKSQS